MAKVYNGAITFGSNFNITAGGPIDTRLVVSTVEDLTTVYGSKATPSTTVPFYQGMVVSISTTGELFILAGDDPSLSSNWKKAGDGKGSVTAANYTAACSLATASNVGQIIYVTASSEVEGQTYSAGPYIVTGAGTLSKLGTTSAAGDIAGDVTTLQGKVSTLESLHATSGTGYKTVAQEISDSHVDYTVSVEVSEPSDVAKRYVFKQESVVGDNKTIATIDIPKDMVVSGGEVRKLQEGEAPEGSGRNYEDLYIVLTIANAASSKLYIPATSLVDVYTANNASGASVEISINNNQISADLSQAVKDQIAGKIDSVSGSGAISVTGDGTDKTVSLLIDANKGNVDISQSTSGVKADLIWSSYE